MARAWILISLEAHTRIFYFRSFVQKYLIPDTRRKVFGRLRARARGNSDGGENCVNRSGGKWCARFRTTRNISNNTMPRQMNARARARERHYISASIRRIVIKMTSRCGLGWRDCDGFYTAKIGRERERVVIKKEERNERGRIKISQRQLTIVKSRPLPPPHYPPSPRRDSRRSGVTDPPLSPTKQLPALLHFPPRLGNVR